MPTLDDDAALGSTLVEGGAPIVEPEPAAALGLPKIDRERVFAALFQAGDDQAGAARQTFGRFEVVQRLGRGGMGTVLEAYDPQLDRMVAIKVLHEAADDGHQQRLLREAQALAQLSHPNVVQVFETGGAEGRLFIAMELVRGRTLRDWHQQPHPWPECLDVYLQAGRGLAAAHGVRIVHRDFKPANCIIDDQGRVRVLDFGLAGGRAMADETEPHAPRARPAPDSLAASLERSRTSSGRALDERLTQTGTLLGTPAYMAPEQGQRATVDARSDQFSFCVALYEAVWGVRPFAAIPWMPALVAGARPSFEVAPSHASQPRPPAWLRQVLARGLAPAPADRFPTMGALLDAIEGHQRRRRRRTLALRVGAGLLGAGTIASGTVALGLAIQRAQQQAECQAQGEVIDERWNAPAKAALAEAFARAEAPSPATTWARVEPSVDAWAGAWRDARAEACQQARVEPTMGRRQAACLEQERWELEALLDVFGAADRTTVLEAVMAVADLPEVARCSDRAWLAADVSLAPEEPRLEDEGVALRRDLARVLALERTGRYDQALALAEACVAAAKALGVPVVEAEAQAKLGTIRWRKADFAASEHALQAGHFLAGRVAHDRIAYATARDLAWVVGVRLARPSEGRLWLEHARMNLVRTGGDPERDPELIVMLGELEGADGRLAEALAAHEQALALREQVLGPEHPEVADSLVNVGRLEAALGDERALATLERARALAQATLGPAHPAVATADNELGVLLVRLGRAQEGIAGFRRAIEIRERALGADDPGLASMLSNLAATLVAEGSHLGEALALLERAEMILARALGPAHPETLAVAINLAFAEAELGADDQALAPLREVLERAERALGREHPLVSAGLANLAHLHEERGDHAGALSLRQQVLAVDEALYGPEHPEVAADLGMLVLAYLRLDQPDAALASARRALAIRERLPALDVHARARTHDAVALALLALDREDEALVEHGHALAIRAAAGGVGDDPADASALRAELDRLRPATDAAAVSEPPSR